MSISNVEDLLMVHAWVWAPKIVNKGLTSGAMGEGDDDIDISDIQDLFLSPPHYHSHRQKKLLISIREYIKLLTLAMYMSKRYYIGCAQN
jgi:hypothetical protein